MPAHRLRNQDWRRSFQQVLERGGSLDVAIARDESVEPPEGRDFLWRVRLLQIDDDTLLVEQPMVLGKPLQLEANVTIVGILTIGQNRWTFRSEVIEATPLPGAHRRPSHALRISMPDGLHRCQRRTHYRVNTDGLVLPEVDIWPLLDPQSVLPAERANELAFEQAASQGAPSEADQFAHEQFLPDVGPKFHGVLLNLGGGGIGVQVRGDDGQTLMRHKIFWMRIDLKPQLEAPICASAKLVHSHMSSSHDYYAGLAFDFTFNPVHQHFVGEQIRRYIAALQHEQFVRRTA